MSSWFSTVNLIGVGGLPSTRYGLVQKAKRESWLSRPRQGRGGGFEYHISSLPKETQQALTIKATNEKLQELSSDPNFQAGAVEGKKIRIREELSRELVQSRRLNSLVKAEGLDKMAKNRMDAKLEIIEAYKVYKSTCPDSATSAQFQFCAAYNRGEISVADWVRETIVSVSQPSLLRWLKAKRVEGIAALGGKYGNRKGSSIIDSNFELNKFVLAVLLDSPHVNAKHLFHAISARFEGTGTPIPSDRTIGRWLNNWREENKELYTFMVTPDQWKNNFMLAVGSTTENIKRYLELWQMDSTPTDIMLADGRHTILGVIDTWSRRAKFLVSKTSKAAAVASLIRRAILDWGVPEAIKMDNGADYASKHVARVCESLEIEQLFCTPFQPWEKPQVERVFKTFSHGLLELCPSFIGHNVAERVSIEARSSFADRLLKQGKFKEESEPIDATFMSSAELQKLCDDWCTGLYWVREHSELGMSPYAKVASWGGAVRRIVGDALRGLDVLLAPVAGNDGRRVVSKKGISVLNHDYWADELIGFVGKNVSVFEDLTDLGKVVVYTPEHEYLCVAICPEILGINRAEMATKSKSLQVQRIKNKSKELKALTRDVKTSGLVNEILEHYQRKADELPPLPGENVEEYSTRRLEAATEAAIMIDEMGSEATFETINEAAGSVSQEAERELAKVISLEMRRESAEERENREKGERMSRYERLLAVDFEGISEQDNAWRKSWEKTPEYAAWKYCGNLYKASVK